MLDTSRGYFRVVFDGDSAVIRPTESLQVLVRAGVRDRSDRCPTVPLGSSSPSVQTRSSRHTAWSPKLCRAMKPRSAERNGLGDSAQYTQAIFSIPFL